MGRSQMNDTPSYSCIDREKLSSIIPPRMNPISSGASG